MIKKSGEGTPPRNGLTITTHGIAASPLVHHVHVVAAAVATTIAVALAHPLAELGLHVFEDLAGFHDAFLGHLEALLKAADVALAAPLHNVYKCHN